MSDVEVVGEIDPGILSELSTLRQTVAGLIQDIGNLEVRKARLIGALGEAEQKAEGLLNQEATRLGIPKGAQFQVSPDGKVRTVPTPQ